MSSTKPCRLLAVLAVLSLAASRASAQQEPAGGGEATSAESLQVRSGFRVELLRSARVGEGSWISMTQDDSGRWIFARDTQGLVRLTPSGENGRTFEVEVIEATLEHCRGLLFAYESLYVNATNSQGFYRLRDTTGDDRYDEVRLLEALRYESRYGHGPNQIVLGPDGMLYVVVGNDVFLPDGVSPSSPYRDPRDDLLLPNPHDSSDARVGCILRTDPEGITWEVIAGGLRNQFDVAFHPDGELFTFDADMEWDVGLPWYRPTRVHHVLSGADYGWRWGSGKWPAYSPDSLPATVDIGLGSPTGLVFGTKSHFPEIYRRALFMGEWQNGRILVVHLTPQGASYTGTFESFIEGGPLNVCDLEFGADGALYFITGGRRSQSGFYRVTYEGPRDVASPPSEITAEHAQKAARARALRRKLETYHSIKDPAAIDLAWKSLGSADVSLRHAARVALERQDTSLWRERALGADNTDSQDTGAALTALLALTRAGGPPDQESILKRLGSLPLGELTRDQLLLALRTYALSFIRHGRPEPARRTAVVEELEPLFPHTSSWVNQELCELLVYLQAPHVVERTVRLLREAAGQEEQIHYATALTHALKGWTPESRRVVLEWLLQARAYRGGKLLARHLSQLSEWHRSAPSKEEQVALRDSIAALEAPAAPGSTAASGRRVLIQRWQLADFAAHPSVPGSFVEPGGKAPHDRSHAIGKHVFREAACIQCHRRGEEGRSTGPDLTHVGRRLDTRGLLAAILEPSAVVDPKYRLMTYVMNDGRVISGSTTAVRADRITVEVDPLTGRSEEVERAQVVKSSPAELSPMPRGLVDTFTQEEILDLVAYLRADVVP